MLWGKFIFPGDYAPPFFVNASGAKPTELPGDIQVAIADLVDAVREDMFDPTREAAVAMNDADRQLSDLILRHLRGEA